MAKNRDRAIVAQSDAPMHSVETADSQAISTFSKATPTTTQAKSLGISESDNSDTDRDFSEQNTETSIEAMSVRQLFAPNNQISKNDSNGNRQGRVDDVIRPITGIAADPHDDAENVRIDKGKARADRVVSDTGQNLVDKRSEVDSNAQDSIDSSANIYAQGRTASDILGADGYEIHQGTGRVEQPKFNKASRRARARKTGDQDNPDRRNTHSTPRRKGTACGSYSSNRKVSEAGSNMTTGRQPRRSMVKTTFTDDTESSRLKQHEKTEMTPLVRHGSMSRPISRAKTLTSHNDHSRPDGRGSFRRPRSRLTIDQVRPRYPSRHAPGISDKLNQIDRRKQSSAQPDSDPDHKGNHADVSKIVDNVDHTASTPEPSVKGAENYREAHGEHEESRPKECHSNHNETSSPVGEIDEYHSTLESYQQEGPGIDQQTVGTDDLDQEVSQEPVETRSVNEYLSVQISESTKSLEEIDNGHHQMEKDLNEIREHIIDGPISSVLNTLRAQINENSGFDEILWSLKRCSAASEIKEYINSVAKLVQCFEDHRRALAQRNQGLQDELLEKETVITSINLGLNAPDSTSREEAFRKLLGEKDQIIEQKIRDMEKYRQEVQASHKPELEKKARELQLDFDKTNDENRALREDKKRLKKIHQDLHEDYQAMRKEKRQEQEGYEFTILNQNQEMCGYYKEYHMAVKHLGLEDLSNEVEDLKGRLHEVTESRDSTYTRNAQLQKDIDSLLAENADLEKQIDKMQQRIMQTGAPPRSPELRSSPVQTPSDYDDEVQRLLSRPQSLVADVKPKQESQVRYMPQLHQGMEKREEELRKLKESQCNRVTQEKKAVDVMEKVRRWQFEQIEAKEDRNKEARLNKSSDKEVASGNQKGEAQSRGRKSGLGIYPPDREQWKVLVKQTPWQRWDGEAWWREKMQLGEVQEDQQDIVRLLRRGQI